MIEALRALDARQPLDIAIFNAGVGGMAPRHVAVEQAERALEVATVNFSSTIAGATAIAERMVGRRAGHIVLIGSVAEAFPLPMAPAYAGSKAGLRMFAEALELRIAPHDVKVTLVSPGFIDTAMSRGVEGPKPFMLTADTAAAAILRAVGRRSSRLTLPRRFAAVRIVAGLLPRALTRAVLRRL